jgi:hypothetical protein
MDMTTALLFVPPLVATVLGLKLSQRGYAQLGKVLFVFGLCGLALVFTQGDALLQALERYLNG